MSIAQTLESLNLTPLRLLGEGAFGKVFHCVDAKGAELAVKVCTTEDARTAAVSEAATMSAMPSHGNLVPITFFKLLPNMSVMAMPLATGGDTLKLMQERQCVPLPEPEIRALFAQLVAAVEHMHSNGLVHRDIKCENILLTGLQRRTVLLADFGFATKFTKGAKALHEAFGSLHYSSPEICAERAYEGPEVDVWSMGVVLYAWVSGRLPFGGATSEEIAARIVSGNFSLPRSASPDLTALLSSMLEVDPAKRAAIADIKKSAWLSSGKPPMPCSTSAVGLTRAIAEAAEAQQQHRRRNSEAGVKKPSRLARAVRAVFGGNDQ